MTVNINWAAIGATLSAIAGSVGVIVTTIWGTNLGTAVVAVLTSISGLLIAIPSWHLASTAATKAKYNHLAKMAALRPVPVTLHDLAGMQQAEQV
jgi:ABC-type dipeptide/oligopeptide/nickel transport system permease component